LLAGESAIDFITHFDTQNYSVKIAGMVKEFHFADYFQNQFKPSRLARQTQLAMVAAKLALEDSGLTPEILRQSGPVAVMMGVNTSAVDIIEKGKERLMLFGPQRMPPTGISAVQPHAVSSALVQMLGVNGRALTLSTACAAGLDAIARATADLRAGKAEMAFAGGTDSSMDPLSVACFGAAGLVPKNVTEPRRASRPFDRDRAGGLMSEAAGVVVLEELTHALSRGATPYLEITGYGFQADEIGGEPASGLKLTMTEALANAGRYPADVDYVCAHGPSDCVIDRVETAMIKAVLGSHAYRIPVTSIKGVTGNPMAAAGALETATCALIMRNGWVPPTANYQFPDPDCDLDYVPRQPRLADIRCALINIHGLGGANSSLVVEQVAGP
jgi:3-oxoacyl-[acyl-carrier-protein] synthase II